MNDHQKLREAIEIARQKVHADQQHCGRLPRSICPFSLMPLSSTLPKTQMVEVWHVEYAYYSKPCLLIVTEGEEIAREKADQISKDRCTCIRVTGPHQQEVPDEQG